MELLQEESLRLLDFTKIREHVAGHVAFHPAVARAMTLRPEFALPKVMELQQETEEGRYLIEVSDNNHIRDASDIRPLVHRLSLEGVLTGGELRQILYTIQAGRQTRAIVLKHHEYLPYLSKIASSIPFFNTLESDIEECIGPAGDVLDKASLEIKNARKQGRTSYGRLEKALKKIIDSPRGREVLQETLITERSFRLVLPVKMEMRGNLPGLVHDVSQSGATLFVEPSETIDLGNTWREWVLEEERLVSKILRMLSMKIWKETESISELLESLTRIDLISAKARYGRSLEAEMPFTSDAESHIVTLRGARHPLLRDNVVPLDIDLGGKNRVVVVTGPNAGGKTVSLKTVGVLALMHQSGLQIPASKDSIMPVFDAIYADIGDRQSLDESLSTFSSHLNTLRQILSSATPRSLVLLDELGSSTDPEEGAALAKGILTKLAHDEVTTLATTHYRSVAAFVEKTPRMQNASVELHPETLQPTFHLSMGIPGRSYALLIASRMGIPDSIIRAARRMLGFAHQDAENLLQELQRERYQAALLSKEAEDIKFEAEQMRRELDVQYAYLNEQRAQILNTARDETIAKVEDVKKRLNEIQRGVSQNAERAKVREALYLTANIQREVKGDEWRSNSQERAVERLELRPGDWVSLRGFDLPGEVIAPPGKDGKVEVRFGTFRARFDFDRLSLSATSESRKPAASREVTWIRSSETHDSLDLRGVRVEESLREADNFLDKALLNGKSQVRVIHGKGTGALRQALREHFDNHPTVAFHEPEEDSIGGDGSTLVTLT